LAPILLSPSITHPGKITNGSPLSPSTTPLSPSTTPTRDIFDQADTFAVDAALPRPSGYLCCTVAVAAVESAAASAFESAAAAFAFEPTAAAFAFESAAAFASGTSDVSAAATFLRRTSNVSL
jgi:hypothetical protein